MYLSQQLVQIHQTQWTHYKLKYWMKTLVNISYILPFHFIVYSKKKQQQKTNKQRERKHETLNLFHSEADRLF